MLKKLFIGLFVLLLFGGNAGLLQLGKFVVTMSDTWESHYTCAFSKNWPLTDAEEKAGESGGSESLSESLEDNEYVSFKWASLRLSGRSDMWGHEADDLFKAIHREIIVPPPKA